MKIIEVTPVNQPQLVSDLQLLAKKLERDPQDVTLDFSSLPRLTSQSLQALEGFAHTADEKQITVILRGVNVAVYKTLKLVRLTSRFSFIH